MEEASDDEEDRKSLHIEHELTAVFDKTIEEVATNPTWEMHPPQEFPKACVVCPDKLFKNEKMVEAHLASAVSALRFTFEGSI